jgi:hypothetical protein
LKRLLDCWDWSDSKKPVGTKGEDDERVSSALPPFDIVSLCVVCGEKKKCEKGHVEDCESPRAAFFEDRRTITTLYPTHCVHHNTSKQHMRVLTW